MKLLLILVSAVVLVAPAAAGATPVGWSKAGAAIALQTAPVWLHNFPIDTSTKLPLTASTYAPVMKVSAIRIGAPAGPTWVVKGVLKAARWNAVATFDYDTTGAFLGFDANGKAKYSPPTHQTETDALCLIAHGPITTKLPYTAFEIGGWGIEGSMTPLGVPLGGCRYVGAWGTDGAFERGGSIAWRPAR